MSQWEDKLTEALALAILAPSEEQAKRAVGLVKQIALNCSESEVAQAKQRATALVEEGGC